MVEKNDVLTRESIEDWGVTRDPWKRLCRRRADREKKGMLIVARCSKSNLPPFVPTPGAFGLVMERIVGRQVAQYTKFDENHSGAGALEDPNNTRLAEILMPKLRGEVDRLLDEALEKKNYVTQKVVLRTI